MIFGPTGVGKTDLSIDIAEYYNAEIFSCDSRQVYKELNVGVARPSIDQLDKIKHHFIGNVSVTEHYSINKYENDIIHKLDNYFLSNDIAVLCGGSGLYIDAVCNGVDEMPDHDDNIRKEVTDFYEKNGIEAIRFELKKVDPEYYRKVDLKNPQRIMRALEMYRITGRPFSEFRKNKKVSRNFNILKIGINLDREVLYERINCRVDKMRNDGLKQEAEKLYEHKGLVALKTIGYRELFDAVESKISFDEAFELIKKNTRNYARRQLTWFRRYEDTEWFSPFDKENIIKYINSNIEYIK